MAVTTYTKGDAVIDALGDIGIGNYEFDIEAEEDVRALKKLDDLMSELQEGRADIGYDQPASAGASAPNDPMGVEQSVYGGIVAMLAIRLCPSYGKTPPGDVRSRASRGLGLITVKYGPAVDMQFTSRVPIGAGNRYTRRNYFPIADTEADMIEEA